MSRVVWGSLGWNDINSLLQLFLKNILSYLLLDFTKNRVSTCDSTLVSLRANNQATWSKSIHLTSNWCIGWRRAQDPNKSKIFLPAAFTSDLTSCSRSTSSSLLSQKVIQLIGVWNLLWVMPLLFSEISACPQSYQGFGLLLVLVILELIPSQNKPATVPSLDKAPLFPEPPAPDDARPSLDLCAGRTSAALGAAVGHTLVVHYRDSSLQKEAKTRSVCLDLKMTAASSE